MNLSKVNLFVELLKNAKRCDGLTYSVGNLTESGMVEAWYFETPDDAQKIEQLFNQTEQHIFIRTLSFSISNANLLYVFHSRYTGASWQGKKYFEWFRESLKD